MLPHLVTVIYTFRIYTLVELKVFEMRLILFDEVHTLIRHRCHILGSHKFNWGLWGIRKAIIYFGRIICNKQVRLFFYWSMIEIKYAIFKLFILCNFLLALLFLDLKLE